MTQEFDQIPGRHRWDPLVDAEQQLMSSRQLSPVAASDEDEADSAAAAVRGAVIANGRGAKPTEANYAGSSPVIGIDAIRRALTGHKGEHRWP